MSRWVALHCCEETDALQANYPNAFLLLCQIVRRARWKPCPITGMGMGEAFIGDFKAAGLCSRKAYEVAKDRLTKCELVSFKGGNKGTTATLLNSTIFSISMEEKGEPRGNPTGNEGASKGNPRGTKHTDTQKTLSTQTPLAMDGASSSPSQKIGWTPEDGHSGITDDDLAAWSVAYPAVNLRREIAAASEWLKSNPTKRKSHHRRFLTNWLSRSQERGGDRSSNAQPAAAPEGTALADGRLFRI